MHTWVVLLTLSSAMPAGSAQRLSTMPAPGSPEELIDLRHLARPVVGQPFVIDKLDGIKAASETPAIAADLHGPGVVDHLICHAAGKLTIVADGRTIFSGQPAKQWPQVYPSPKSEQHGSLPFAFPLVHTAGPYSHCLVPIPYSERLLVTVTGRGARVWLAGRRLAHPAAALFSTDSSSEFLQRLKLVHRRLFARVDRLPSYPGAEPKRVGAYCPPRSRRVLAEAAGPRELIGWRVRFLPGALELLRYQVIEITIDGVTSVRMPLADFLGVSHPWPHAWFPGAGDWVAGVVYPIYYGRGWREPAVITYFKLPVPFRKKLRIELWNRSADFPATFEGTLLFVPLDQDQPVGRLCGTSRRVNLLRPSPSPIGPSKPAANRRGHQPQSLRESYSPSATLADGQQLLSFTGPGRLIGLSTFSTGHKRWNEWTRRVRFELVGTDGGTLSGAGLLPFAMQGLSGNIVFRSPTWNHNSLERSGRCGAGRHYWRHPLAIGASGSLRYVSGGPDGPRRAEVAALWYQFDSERPFVAPQVDEQVERLPAVKHDQPGKPLAGGWAAEAESLAKPAQATAGKARAETFGAADAFASDGAYLAWNADRPGDALDLIVPMPRSDYVQLWYHRLLFPAGGVFRIELTRMDTPPHGLEPALDEAEWTARVLGRSPGPVAIDCYDFWPHRQAYRFEMPPLRNPAPGQMARIRFTCMGKQRESRGYLLAIDQIGLDPAPLASEDWHAFETTVVVRHDAHLSVAPMAIGRSDFYGWGGLQLTASRPGRAVICLSAPVASPQAQAIELRGVVEQGDWRIQFTGWPGILARPASSHDKPTVWTIPLPEPLSAPCTLQLEIVAAARVESKAAPSHRRSKRESRLLLDAWRFLPQSPPKQRQR